MKGRPFALLGVNTDKSLRTAKDAVKKNGLNWRSWYDGSTRGPICSQFKISGFPTIFLLDHNGVIRFKNVRGPALDAALEILVKDAENAGMSGAPVDTGEYRVFKTADGKHEVEACYVSFGEGKVTLRRKDTKKEIQIQMKLLSKEDQAFIRKIRRGNAG